MIITYFFKPTSVGKLKQIRIDILRTADKRHIEHDNIYLSIFQFSPIKGHREATTVALTGLTLSISFSSSSKKRNETRYDRVIFVFGIPNLAPPETKHI